MIESRRIMIFAAFLIAVGLWLMLPRGRLRGRLAGMAVGTTGLGILASQLPWIGSWIHQSVFLIVAGVTVVSAAAAITLRNPVYCALWFGLSLLGTAGLFFFQGAQFLAVATIIVYAGAILVTFLFVLMLAEPTGRALYDRTSWEALVSAFSGALVIGLLSMTVTSVLTTPADAAIGASFPASQTTQGGAAANAETIQRNETPPYTVRQLGEELFNDHYLIAVEVAGVLLLAALVGAAVIVGHARGPLAGPTPAGQSSGRTGGPAHG